MTTNKTGYPSIDKPWLKYYSEEAINTPLPEMTMYEYIWQNNKDYLNDIALQYYGTKITYNELFNNIKKAASLFHELGVNKGDIVTIMSMHTPECIYAIYGLNYIGATANLVYMTLAEKEIIDTINNTESKLLLVLDVALDKINNIKDQINIPILVLGVSDSMPFHIKLGYKLKVKPKKYEYQSFKRLLDNFKDNNPPQSKDHEAPAVIVYTSGTTGEPKGVVLSSDSLNTLSEQLNRTDKNYQHGDLVLFVIPIFVGFGIGMLHHGIARSQLLDLFLDKDFTKSVKRFFDIKPKRFIISYSMIDEIMKHDNTDLSKLEDIMSGGYALDKKKEEAFNKYLMNNNSKTYYYHGYGMSEFSSAIALNIRSAHKISSCGIPLAEVNVKVVDIDCNKELKYLEVGELCFCAPNSMIEYYKNTVETNKTVEIDGDGNKWIHTGDLGYVDKDGFIFIVGRLKRIYLTKSEDGSILKIYPRRIEELLMLEDNIKQCAVICVNDENRINVPYAFITVNNNFIKEDNVQVMLLEKLKKHLSSHEYPKSIAIVDEMPITQSGKIDYQKLERFLDEKRIDIKTK